MKVAVITPYYDTPEKWLQECHLSVKAQTFPCTHFIVADGKPIDVVDSWDAQHIKLPVNHADYGDTPRGVGSVVAIAQRFDAIAYLDADNWYSQDHIASMVKLQQKTGAGLVSSTRNLYRLDGTLLGKCPEVDGEIFVDTNCYFIARSAFQIVPLWWMMELLYGGKEGIGLGKEIHSIDDRVIWAEVKRLKLRRAHSGRATVAYRTAFRNHYLYFGEEPPAGAKSGKDIFKTMAGAIKEYQRVRQRKKTK